MLHLNHTQSCVQRSQAGTALAQHAELLQELAEVALVAARNHRFRSPAIILPPGRFAGQSVWLYDNL